LGTKKRRKNKKKNQSDEGEQRAIACNGDVLRPLLRRRSSTVILQIKYHCLGLNLIFVIRRAIIHGINCLMDFYSHCFSGLKAIIPSYWLRIALNQL
jgi:hypothetical protein